MKLLPAYCNKCGDLFEPLTPEIPPVCGWCRRETPAPNGILDGLIKWTLVTLISALLIAFISSRII